MASTPASGRLPLRGALWSSWEGLDLLQSGRAGGSARLLASNLHPGACLAQDYDAGGPEDDEEDELGPVGDGADGYADGDGDPCPNCGRLYKWV